MSFPAAVVGGGLMLLIFTGKPWRLFPRTTRSRNGLQVNMRSIRLELSVQSTNKSRLPLTLGRVPPSDLLVKDSEVSGKHAMIKWNLDKLKWELVDMGSLNGKLLKDYRPMGLVMAVEARKISIFRKELHSLIEES